MLPERPIAFHITFATYGSHLHGDPRGSVDRAHNHYLEPFLETDPAHLRSVREAMRFDAVRLSTDQRHFVEDTVPGICTRGGWEFMTTACAPDHVHVLLSTPREGVEVRRWLKRWLGEALSRRWPPPRGRSWFAEGGSVKWVWELEYVRRAAAYIERQRVIPRL